MKAKNAIGAILAIALTAFFIGLKEWQYLGDFNHILFGNYFDALKNYYTILYHVKWDESLFWFEGMNYPYGEHVLFTDNQPLFSTFLKVLQHSGLAVDTYVSDIINSLLYVNLLLSALFSYLCLTKLKISPWVAVLAAVALTFLSPQTHRINGHFALSYSALIPFLLYLGLNYLKKPTWSFSVLISLSSIAVTFLHAYYLAFVLMLFSVLMFISILYKNVSLIKGISHLFLQVFLAFLLVQLFMFITDPFTDRPSHPWSPFLGQYTPYGILIPLGTPIGDFIHQNFGIPPFDWEAETYIGVAAALLLLLSIFTLPLLFFKKLKKAHPFYFNTPEAGFLVTLSLTAFITPFVFALLTNSTELYQLLGPIRQFRSISRFIWIAFFSFNFYLLYWLNQSILPKHKVLGGVLLSLSVLLLVYDAYWHSKRPFHTQHKEPLFLANSSQQKILQQATQYYDVLIPVPHFHIGAESFIFSRGGGDHFKNSMAASYASGLPLTSVMLSRSSLSQSIESLSYIFPTVEKASFLKNLKNKRCLILVQDTTFLSSIEQHILHASKKIVYSDSNFTLRALDKEKLSTLLSQDSLTKKFNQKSLQKGLYFKDFESSLEKAYFGSSALKLEEHEPRLIDSLNVTEFPDIFTIGFWMTINVDTKAIEEVMIQFYDENNQQVYKQHSWVSSHFRALNKEWAFVELTVYKPEDGKLLQIMFRENNLFPTPTFIDGLSIKAVDS